MNSMDEQCSVNMEAWTLNNVCVSLEEVKLDIQKLYHLKNLKLAGSFPR